MKRRMSKSTISSLSNYGLVIAIFIIVQICSAAGSPDQSDRGAADPCLHLRDRGHLPESGGGYLRGAEPGPRGLHVRGSFFQRPVFPAHGGLHDHRPPVLSIAIVIGALAAALFGFLIGIPVLRLRGDYLAIVTLAFGEIIKNLLNIVYLGRDENGIHLARDAARPSDVGGGRDSWSRAPRAFPAPPEIPASWSAIILILVTLFIVQNIINSRTGRAIMAIRDNRIAAESIGINVTKYKLLAFTVSAALAGVAGALYAHNLSSLTVSKFDYNTSILILVYVVLGGIGSIKGSMIATIILYVLPEMLRFLQDYRMLIYAVVLIIMMLFNWAPGAIAWRERIVEKFKRNKTKGVS